jgi:hypothetical protein
MVHPSIHASAFELCSIVPSNMNRTTHIKLDLRSTLNLLDWSTRSEWHYYCRAICSKGTGPRHAILLWKKLLVFEYCLWNQVMYGRIQYAYCQVFLSESRLHSSGHLRETSIAPLPAPHHVSCRNVQYSATIRTASSYCEDASVLPT